MVSITLEEACVILSMGASRLQFIRNGCEVLEKKKQPNLKEGHVLQVALQTHYLEIGMWQTRE